MAGSAAREGLQAALAAELADSAPNVPLALPCRRREFGHDRRDGERLLSGLATTETLDPIQTFRATAQARRRRARRQHPRSILPRAEPGQRPRLMVVALCGASVAASMATTTALERWVGVRVPSDHPSRIACLMLAQALAPTSAFGRDANGEFRPIAAATNSAYGRRKRPDV